MHVLEHPGDAVAVAVVPAADEEARDPDAVVASLRGRAIPERAVALLTLVRQHPRRRIEPVAKIRLIDHVVRGARTRIVEILAHLPGVDMDDAVDEMDI